MAVWLSSLPSKMIFFADAMCLNLGMIECTLGHVPALHAVTFAQTLEVIENAPQHFDILFQMHSEIMRMPPEVVCQAMPRGVSQVILNTPLLQCLSPGYSCGISAKKTASREIRWKIAGNLGQRIAIVRRKLAIRV